MTQQLLTKPISPLGKIPRNEFYKHGMMPMNDWCFSLLGRLTGPTFGQRLVPPEGQEPSTTAEEIARTIALQREEEEK